MSYEEKSAWVMGVLAVVTYTTYVAIILSLAADTPLADVDYVGPLLWTIGASIVASIVIHILLGIITGIMTRKDVDKKDLRDRQIYRFGEYIGHGFVIAGAVGALILAMLELDHFWIANVIYLSFVLSAILGTVVKVVAYRRGFQPW
jgi:hypothetical protein